MSAGVSISYYGDSIPIQGSSGVSRKMKPCPLRVSGVYELISTWLRDRLYSVDGAKVQLWCTRDTT